MFKKLINKYLIIFVLLISYIFFINNTVYAEQGLQNILHEEKTTQVITKGVTYEMSRRFTEAGWLDVHVIKVDLNEPYIKVGVLDSIDKYGKKETLQQLIKSNGAVAGINGDFYITHREYTDTIGMVAKDEQLQSVYDDSNNIENGLNAFIIDEMNNRFIDFYSIKLSFSNKKGTSTKIGSINKITNIGSAVCFNRKAMLNTESIDKMRTDLYKIVVENNCITYISKEGETVNVPEKGYIIVMPKSIAQKELNKYKVGNEVSLNIESTVDIDKVKVALSGGGKILEKGKIPENPGLVVGKNARHPRTALGLSKDKSKLILMVVDGRSYSLGANHKEMAEIMKEYGAYDAMHLDGGGSSTMVGRTLGTDGLKVLNIPSDGVQRRIVNGLGIYSTAPKGKISNIKVSADKKRVFVNNPISFGAVGYDDYYNPVKLPIEQVIWVTKGIKGKWENNTFYPSVVGEGIISAIYKGVKSTIPIIVMDKPKFIEIYPKIIKVSPNGFQKIKLMGVNAEGYKSEVETGTIQWEFDHNLGKIENGIFKANNIVGQSKLIGKIGNTVVEGYIAVGDKTEKVNSFENTLDVEGVGYPNTVKSTVKIVSKEVYEGKKAVNLTYYFKGDMTNTQAAYIQFKKPIELQAQPIALSLMVKGDNSNNWLRGRIIDSDGEKHNITFSYDIDWKGWKYVQANLPKNISYPVQLDRIYITALNQKAPILRSITIDDLCAVYPLHIDVSSLTHESKLKDYLNQSIIDSDKKSFDITVFGSTQGKNRLLDQVVQREVLKQMNKKSEIAVFSGFTDINPIEMAVPFVKWRDKYETIDYKNVRIIQLATSKKGMRATDPNQWKKFQQDLETAKQDHILIIMNQNPLDEKGFTDTMEGQLFHSIIKNYREKTNKNIFVINGSGYKTEVNVIEGIRYIDINGLWYKIKNNSVNLSDTFNMIRFRINGNKIIYDIQPVYPKIKIKG